MTALLCAAVAAEYPQSILNGTPTCSNHSGTALYETNVAGEEESGCVCLFIQHEEQRVPLIWYFYLSGLQYLTGMHIVILYHSNA